MPHLNRWIGMLGIPIGLAIGFLTGTRSLQIGLLIFTPLFIAFFFANFEQVVLGLLILRGFLDPFSRQGLTRVFAVGLSGLTLTYITVRLLSKQPVKIDGFWWVFAGWVAVQGIWVVLLPLGGLGSGEENLSNAAGEWVRIFSWLMGYLLTMQLKDRLHPEQFVNQLLFALIVPLSAATLQLILPASLLPSFLTIPSGDPDESRINGTLGLSNTFATFLIFFIGLTYWKLIKAQRRLPWVILLITLVFFLVSTKTLVGIFMLIVLIGVLVVPRLSPVNLFGSVILLILFFGLFASTDFGRERLASITQTPLLNPDIDVSRSILLSFQDNNSFNWRIAQWTSLLGHWQNHPILGYGLQTSASLGYLFAYAHNDYVRALVEEGIVGLILFLTFLGIQFIRLFLLIYSPASSKTQRSFCLVLIAILLAAMVGMITENIWSHTTLFFYWFSMLAIAGWDWGKTMTASSDTEKRLTHFR
jgi:O-antigen ligase